MELYITRHGQTISNEQGITCGQQGGELTDKGISQANLIAKRLSSIPFDHIYCSDLNRTKQTLHQILLLQPQDIDLIIHYTKKLREINIKSLEGYPCAVEEQIRSEQKVPYRFTRTAEGDENYVEVFYRVSQVIDEMIESFIDSNYNSGINESNYIEINKQDVINMKELNELFIKGELTNKDSNKWNINKKVLIVSHGGVICEIVNNFLFRMGRQMVERIDLTNCSLFYLKMIKSQKQNGKLDISLEIYNDASHLDLQK